ncbi:MAG: GAF domain-containing protein [Anaerolineae bacterium]|nr:GAF domain-containing protein [Anaerolineae bacterium]
MISHAVSTELLHTISRQFNASLDLNEVMGRVLQLTVKATGATRGSLFLLDEQGRVTHYILARPEQAPEISQQNVAKVMAEGLSGWVYRHQQEVLVGDTAADERWIRLHNDTETTNAALAVPLLYLDRVNGVLVLHHEQTHFFDESHLALVTSIAGQASIAVENARLFTQIKHERETLEALITGMPIPVLVVDALEHIAFFNQAARQLVPLAQAGEPLLAVEGGAAIKAALDLTHQNPDQPNVEIRWPDERVFSVSTNETPRLGTVITLNDITELKKLDEMKTVFVETVSHDLRNPLATIHGFATLLQREQLSERGRSNLAGLMQGVTQIQSLIQNLLDLARIEAKMDEQVESCDLVEITGEVLASLELQLAEKEMTLTADLPSGLPPVSGNPLRLSQVVTNLVGNAIKYTPRGGRIFVGVNREKDGHIRLQVSDNGPGIPAEDQDQIFEKFYRVPTMEDSEWIEGTGLGLSIVKAVAEGYGGSVWVESELGAGSTFICIFPALPVSDEQP